MDESHYGYACCDVGPVFTIFDKKTVGGNQDIGSGVSIDESTVTYG